MTTRFAQVPRRPARVAFLGLGAMGRPMAGHLLRAGLDLVVYNRTPAAADELVRAGARRAGTPAEAVAGADLALICVTADDAVRAIVAGPDGVLAGAAPGLLVVDHSTVAPATARDMAAAGGAAGVSFVDAPVSGGVPGAAAGSLTVMAGGTEQDVERLRGFVEGRYAASVRRLGPAGAGATAKLINQFLTIVHTIAAADAMAVAERAGLDLGELFAVLRASYGQSRMLERAVPDHIIPRDWASGFVVDILAKDARLVAEALDLRAGLDRAARAVLENARHDGLGGRDAAVAFLTLGGSPDAAG